MGWFAINILNIVPVTRKGGEANPLARCEQALRDNKILILFPEGTRGEPGILSPLKSGIWHLSQRVPEASVVPVWLCGTERIMAKGTASRSRSLLMSRLAMRCIHTPKKQFMDDLRHRLLELQQQTSGNLTHASPSHAE